MQSDIPQPGGEQDLPRQTEPRQPVILNTQELFGEATEVLIRHSEEIYRLRITRSGKLILMK